LPERFSCDFHVSHYSNAEYQTKQHLFLSETKLSAFGPRVLSRPIAGAGERPVLGSSIPRIATKHAALRYDEG
jgi:hypothetical protein